MLDFRQMITDTTMDFCAVLLAAGKGHKLKDLTENCPKFLLPIANRPMIYYPLKILLNAGFRQIVIIIAEKDTRKLKEALKSHLDMSEINRIKTCIINAEDDLGTLEAIVHYKDSILPDTTSQHLCVFSCDTIINFDIQPLCDLNRIYDCPIALALSKNSLKQSEVVKIGLRLKSKKKFTDVVGLNESEAKICFYQAEEEIQDQIVIPNISPTSRIKLLTQLVDPHVYIISKQLLDTVSLDEKLRVNLTRIKSEAIPYIVRKSDHSGDSFVSEKGDATKGDHLFEPCRYLMLSSDVLVWRADSINNFYEANRRILQLTISSARQAKNESMKCAVFDCPSNSTVIGTNLIGNNTSFSDEVKNKKNESVKNNVIGSDCHIGKSKLIGCVLFSNVVIGNNCVLENCILANHSRVEDGCEMNNVLVAASQTVQTKSKLSHETVKKIVQFQ